MTDETGFSHPPNDPVRRGGRSQPLCVALYGVGVAVVVTLTIAGYGYGLHHAVQSLRELRVILERVERNVQRLDAGISFDSKRRQLMLNLRDEILRANAVLSLDDAYQYAALVVEASEKYPAVDPLLLTAIGIVESAYDTDATSHVDAKGLYQIWPPTGRLLARARGLEYSDGMLYDPERNTELAALYLDILFSVYNDAELALAEYNGGPVNAGYWRDGNDRLAAETRDYVPKVMKTYRAMSGRLEPANVFLDSTHHDLGDGIRDFANPRLLVERGTSVLSSGTRTQ